MRPLVVVVVVVMTTAVVVVENWQACHARLMCYESMTLMGYGYQYFSFLRTFDMTNP
jgi:hypothetical protein